MIDKQKGIILVSIGSIGSIGSICILFAFYRWIICQLTELNFIIITTRQLTELNVYELLQIWELGIGIWIFVVFVSVCIVYGIKLIIKKGNDND